MTVPANEVRKAIFIGDGVQTVFPYTFRIFKTEDMQVFLDEIEQTTGFTVSGVGGTSGNVTFTVAPAGGVDVVLLSQTSIEQPFDYVAGDKFPAETHESGLDRAMVVVAEFAERFARTLTLPAFKTENISIGTIIPNFLTAWDATGKILESVEVDVNDLVAEIPVSNVGVEANDILRWSGTQYTNVGDWYPSVRPNSYSGLNVLPAISGDGGATYVADFTNPAFVGAIAAGLHYFLIVPNVNSLATPTLTLVGDGPNLLTGVGAIELPAGALIAEEMYLVIKNQTFGHFSVQNYAPTGQRKVTIFGPGGGQPFAQAGGMKSAHVRITAAGGGGAEGSVNTSGGGGGGSTIEAYIDMTDVVFSYTATINVPGDTAVEVNGGAANYIDNCNTINDWGLFGGGSGVTLGAGAGGTSIINSQAVTTKLLQLGGNAGGLGFQKFGEVSDDGGHGGGSYWGGGGRGGIGDGGNAENFGGGGGGASGANTPGLGKQGVCIIVESTEVLL